MIEGVPRRVNRDGSRNIYCRRCGRLVGTNTANINFGSVTACAVCDAADNDIELSNDVLESLQSCRLPGDGLIVPQFVLQEERRNEAAIKEDPMSTNPEDRLGSRFWMRAATITAVKTVRDKIATALGSQKLARDKKRKRIFDRSIADELEDK